MSALPQLGPVNEFVQTQEHVDLPDAVTNVPDGEPLLPHVNPFAPVVQTFGVTQADDDVDPRGLVLPPLHLAHVFRVLMEVK